MNPDSTLAVTNTCPKDGVHLSVEGQVKNTSPENLDNVMAVVS